MRRQQGPALEAVHRILGVAAAGQLDRRVRVTQLREPARTGPRHRVLQPDVHGGPPQAEPIAQRLVGLRHGGGDRVQPPPQRVRPRAHAERQHDRGRRAGQHDPRGEHAAVQEEHDQAGAGQREPGAAAERQGERHAEQGRSGQGGGAAPAPQGQPGPQQDDRPEADHAGHAHHVRRAERAHGPHLLTRIRRAGAGERLHTADQTLRRGRRDQGPADDQRVRTVAYRHQDGQRNDHEDLDVPDITRQTGQHVGRGQQRDAGRRRDGSEHQGAGRQPLRHRTGRQEGGPRTRQQDGDRRHRQHERHHVGGRQPHPGGQLLVPGGQARQQHQRGGEQAGPETDAHG